MRVTQVSKFTADDVAAARKAATSLVSLDSEINIKKIFGSKKLEEVEDTVKKLGAIAGRSWLILAMLLYTVIYDQKLFEQSGMSWKEYSTEARKRLGLDPRDITELLSAARFFIQYHERLTQKGWTPLMSNRKLARAELALSLSGDIDETISHLVTDSWHGFKTWYSSFKNPSSAPKVNLRYKGGKFYVDNIEAITLSPELSKKDRGYLSRCLRLLARQMQEGIDPLSPESKLK